jgi:TonB-dependent SusC/RagA subfamily outer membrane receptor
MDRSNRWDTIPKSDPLAAKKENEKPIYFLDGKEFKGDLNKIDPGKIESINVLKDQAAIARYGQKAKYGVIEIITKNGAATLDTVPENTPVFEKAEVEASVDKNEWRKFLETNLQPIIENATSKGIPLGQHTVKIRFLVKKDGSITDFKALNDPGYGLAQKVLEIIPKSPKWKPAEQNGKPVNSYHTQPITFVISDGEESKETGSSTTAAGKLQSQNIHN